MPVRTTIQPISRHEGATRQIDAMCGVIITITLLSTFTAKYDQVLGHAAPLPFFFDFGYLSLQMFFAVAGYQVMREVAADTLWSDYAQGRLARLLPAVIPAVSLSYGLISVYGLPHFQADLASFLANATMIADFVGAPDCGGAFWRLKIEIMFAAGFGLVWFGLGRRAGAMMLVLALAACALHLQRNAPHRTVLDAVGLLTMDGYLPQFTVGIGFFLLRTSQSRTFWLAILALCAALIVATNGLDHGCLVLSAYGVIGLASLGLLPDGPPIQSLAWLGRPFLAIFLVHQSVGFVVIHALERLGLGSAGAVMTACLAAILCGVGVDAAARALRAAEWADIAFKPRNAGNEEALLS